MCNELFFLIHVCSIAGFTLGSLLLGKEALTASICLMGILANVFVTKQIMLFGLPVVTTDVFMIGCILGLNMLQEYFGREAVKMAIIINTLLSLFYLGMSNIHLLYTPSSVDWADAHFQALLAPMPRIIIASISVYVLVQIIDALLYGFLKILFRGKYLVIRNVVSLASTQLLDTVLFSFAALYGVVHSVLPIIIMSYTIKMLVIICNTPFISLSKRLINPEGYKS